SDSEAEKSPCCSSFGKSPPKEERPPVATKIEVVSMSKLPFHKNNLEPNSKYCCQQYAYIQIEMK
ncbi:hypothetical protein TNCT_449701, partial [Trichonephila clavata]